MRPKTKKSSKKGEHVLFSSSPFYFDDCPICRAIKKAEDEGRELGSQELKKAFKKANEKDLSKN